MISRNPPLVAQVIAQIVAEISGGELQAGDALPSEAEFSQRLGVSRATVREALSRLEDGGAVIRRHGAGTFVSPLAASHPQALTGWFAEVSNFVDVLRHLGHDPGCRLVGIWLEPAGAAAELLLIQVDDHVVRYCRLFLASGEPVIYSVNYMPYDLVERSGRDAILTEHRDFASTYEFVRRYCGITVAHHRAEIRAVLADQELASLLQCTLGDPLLRTEDTGYGPDMRPLWYGQYWYRADRISFEQMRNPKMIVE